MKLTRRSIGTILASIGVPIGAIWLISTGDDRAPAPAANRLAAIHLQVARDAEAQYAIAARSGTAIDRCVHAGMVAAAHLQAQDEPAFRKWKATEAADCERVGIQR